MRAPRALPEPRVAVGSLLAVMVAGSALALGAVHLSVLVVISICGFLALGYGLYTGLISRRIPLPAQALAALGLFSLFQALPLPAALVAWLAPENASTWHGAYQLLGVPWPSWLPLALDPGAARIEGLKWLTYAAAFTVAAALGARVRGDFGPAVVFGSAVTTALVALGHRLAGLTSVYGFYNPVGEFARTSIGPLLNPNNLAGYLNLGAFCGIGLLLAKRPVMPRWALALGAALLFAASVQIGSRGGLLSLAIGVVLLAIAVSRSRSLRERGRAVPLRALLGVVAVILVGGGLALLAVLPRAAAQFDDKSFEKLAMASWVWPMIKDHPVWGVGRGAFESAFQAYRIGQNNLVYSHAENFVVQWVAEWGVPLGLGALAYFVWAFRPRALGVSRQPVALGVIVGLLVLLAHNIVDLGLEVPAVALAALVAVGSCWGSAASAQSKGTRLRAVLPAIALVAVPSLFVSLALATPETVGQARRRLDYALEALKPADTTAVRSFRADLQRAMLAHPADPYFPRVGAIVAFRAGDRAPLPFIDRALELGLTNGRSHLLLARMLTSWQRTEQALLELRFAADYDPQLALPIADAALALTREPAKLLRAVPPGPNGAPLLRAMSRRLKSDEDVKVRAELLHQATSRAPDDTETRSEVARLLTSALAPHSTLDLCRGAERAGCIRNVEAHAQALSRLLPNSSEGTEVLARLELTLDDPASAAKLLAAECPKVEQRRRCLILWLEAVGRIGDSAQVASVARSAGGQTCASMDDCAHLYDSVGDALGRTGNLQLALGYVQRAAQEDPNEARWSRVADLASRLGQHGLALDALHKVERRRGRADPRLRARIDEERAYAAGTHSNLR